MAKILVVDDSSLARHLASAPLEEAGHQVLGVEPASLFDVLASAYEFRPDLIITDYQMPNCNGLSLVRAIREDPSLGRIPIMVLTAHRDNELMERLLTLGIDGILFKGKGMQELVDRVGEIIGV
jgi:CheY-like chemotaxis protein